MMKLNTKWFVVIAATVLFSSSSCADAIAIEKQEGTVTAHCDTREV